MCTEAAVLEGGGNDDVAFTESALQRLNSLAYKRKDTLDLLAEDLAHDDGFFRHLLETEVEVATAFDAVMRAGKGKPYGLEYSNKAGTAWQFVVEDASEPGKVRTQSFDGRGFFGHHAYGSLEAAVSAMVSYGYVNADHGALDRASRTPAFDRGNAVSDLIRRLNLREITHEQYAELVAALP